MSRKIGSKFDKLVNYINTFKPGEMIHRRDLLMLIYGNPHGSRTTVDKWKRQLIVCNYIKETPTPGVYEKVSDIPDLINTAVLEYFYSRFNR